MSIIADILMVAGALGATVYCYVLARRLAKFNDLEAGVGGAVAVLSTQVDDLTRTLKSAQATAGNSSKQLQELTKRAEGASKRMELLLASMHDLPDPEELKAFRTSKPTTMFVRHSDDEEFGTPVEELKKSEPEKDDSQQDVSDDAEEKPQPKPKSKRRKQRKRRGKKSDSQTDEQKPAFKRAS
ncbi:hypothetical protein shim_33330 [Shimia sp. SK013]|uniref:hypothetical protein n=1 Tax=Shimia sp. SK013 TaxID=1389006 RepID=UPI0006CDE141|nr:hypothetical protein shim_33330 [Shimia sp. SK013]